MSKNDLGICDTYEKVEPTFEPDAPKAQYQDPHEYFIYRPDTDVVKLGMGIHPVGTPFDQIEFEGSFFHIIKDELWQKGEVGVDAKGVSVMFYRQKGEFKGYYQQ